MESEKTSKLIALIITVIVVVLSLVRHISYADVGVFCGCSLRARMLHPFFHVNIFHAAANAWCLLCFVFFYGASVRRMAAAYLIAVSFPAEAFAEVADMSVPVVGMSGVVFALAGLTSFSVRRRMFYHLWMWAFVAAGALLPGVCASMHAYCLACGTAAAALVVPVKKGEGG